MSNLPPGVTRSDGVREDITHDSCKALRFEYRHLDEDTVQVLGLIVRRDGVKNIQPDENGKALHDLRPGDNVMPFDRFAEIIGVEIYG